MQLAAIVSRIPKFTAPKYIVLCLIALLTSSCGRMAGSAGDLSTTDGSLRDSSAQLVDSTGSGNAAIGSEDSIPQIASNSSVASGEKVTILNNLEIASVDGGNELRVALNGPAVYSLDRTAPSEYSLKIESTGVSVDVPNSIVSPSKNGRIRSARLASSSADAGNTVVKIFAAPQVELEAVNGHGGIVVKATDSSAGMMAQLAPEEAAAPSAPGSSAPDTVAAATGEGVVDGVATDEFAALLDDQQYSGRLISLDLQDTDIDNALRIIAEVSNLNIVTTEDVAGKVTLRLIDVPWDQALDVILKINSLGKVQEGNVVRIAPLEKLRAERESLKQAKVAEEQLEELKVRYIRVSYAQAAELKPLVDTVISERGTVVNDERTNQLIVKDTRVGLARVLELVKKLDLRTPQVLLETQIVESKRDFIRQLGSQFGFNFKQTPETGNATGWNFPNSIDGGLAGNNLGALNQSSAGVMSLLFGSADGTRNLDLVLAAAETDGLAKVISRPSVATTNNRQATIKSVEKIRVKLPSNGSNVTVGQGAQSGGATTGTETIEAGIILEVTPQASPDYYILLDINAKSSSFTQRNVDDIPSEIERAATSTILVSSGQTFVMGGIYKIRENVVNSGIPFLKDVPVLGHMFRFSSVDDSDEELLFFITPRIIEGSFDDAAMKASL